MKIRKRFIMMNMRRKRSLIKPRWESSAEGLKEYLETVREKRRQANKEMIQNWLYSNIGRRVNPCCNCNND